MKQHADYLPGAHQKISDQIAAILLDETVNCETGNQCNID